MTSLIIDFPEDILLKICTSWIPLKSLCRLDSAICVHNKRQYFLKSLGSSYVSINNSPPTTPTLINTKDKNMNNITTNSLKWLKRRK